MTEKTLDSGACIELIVGIIHQARRDAAKPKLCSLYNREALQQEAAEFLEQLQEQAEEVDWPTWQPAQSWRRPGRGGGIRWEFQESDDSRRMWRQRQGREYDTITG